MANYAFRGLQNNAWVLGQEYLNLFQSIYYDRCSPELPTKILHMHYHGDLSEAR